MDENRQPAPLADAPVVPSGDEPSGTLADELAVGACAGLGTMALVAAATPSLMRAGITTYSPLLLWYFRGGSWILLGLGLVAAILAESPLPRRLFALSSLLTLAFLALQSLGLDRVPLQVGFGLAMLGGSVAWMRRPVDREGNDIGEAVPARLPDRPAPPAGPA